MTAKTFFTTNTVAASALVALLACTSSAQAQPKAALTRDIDRPSAQPVHGHCSAFVAAYAAKCTLYTVPAGKRLVVETVTYAGFAETSKRVYQILFGDGTAYSGYTNVLFDSNLYLVTPVAATVEGGSTYTGSQALKIYLEEGAVLVGGLSTSGTGGYSQQFGFSGFLVDK